MLHLRRDDADHGEEQQPMFHNIERGDLEAVQQRVLADAAVLEERWIVHRLTPLMAAIILKKPAIALWIIEHRGQHNLEAGDDHGQTALHHASKYGQLAVVQALVAAGANPAALTALGSTPLIDASFCGYADIVAFLLQQPAVKASVEHINPDQDTALSVASYHGRHPTVQLLLDAGADPTIPAGQHSPLNRATAPRAYTWLEPALTEDHTAIAALLRHVIAEAERARALHKARSLFGIRATSLACLQGRAEQGQAPPRVELTSPPQKQQQQQQQQQQQHEKLWETAAFAVGVSGGEKDSGLCEDLYLKLLAYMLPGAWADKGPEA